MSRFAPARLALVVVLGSTVCLSSAQAATFKSQLMRSTRAGQDKKTSETQTAPTAAERAQNEAAKAASEKEKKGKVADKSEAGSWR